MYPSQGVNTDMRVATQLIDGLRAQLQDEKNNKTIQKKIWDTSLAIATSFGSKVLKSKSHFT